MKAINIYNLCVAFNKHANHPNIDRLLEKYKNYLTNNGIDISSLSKIGEGDMGQAYLMPDGNVLKATTDGNELYAAERLLNKNFEHLINVYNVIDLTYLDSYQASKWSDENPSKFGLIIQDKITPIYGSDRDLFNNALYEVIESLNDEKNNFSYPFHRSWQAIERMPVIPGREENFKKGLSILKNKFHLDKILAELTSAGIKSDDFHAGNMGKKNNENYVLFDIGGPNMQFY